MYFSLSCKGSKRLFKVCVWEGVGDRTETAIFWPPLLWPSALYLSRSPGLLNRSPRGPLCWLSLPPLISNFFGPQLIRGSKGPFGLMWLSLPHLVYKSVSNWSLTVWFLSWLSYIIVQRPLNRQLDLWNGMFDRHPAEITVMQFTGHYLPVHQSMSVPWEFFLPRPISSANFRPRDFLSQLPLECVTSGASPWNGIFGKIEGQNTTHYTTRGAQLTYHVYLFKFV